MDVDERVRSWVTLRRLFDRTRQRLAEYMLARGCRRVIILWYLQCYVGVKMFCIDFASELTAPDGSRIHTALLKFCKCQNTDDLGKVLGKLELSDARYL